MRPTFLLATGALAAIMAAAPALAQTPKDTVVMAKQIDDIISLDPGRSVRVLRRRGDRQRL